MGKHRSGTELTRPLSLPHSQLSTLNKSAHVGVVKITDLSVSPCPGQHRPCLTEYATLGSVKDFYQMRNCVLRISHAHSLNQSIFRISKNPSDIPILQLA